MTSRSCSTTYGPARWSSSRRAWRAGPVAAAAVLPAGRTGVGVVQAWSGLGCPDQFRRDLPGLLARVKPQALGWLPAGPAASLAADLAERKGRAGWPPPGV